MNDSTVSILIAVLLFGFAAYKIFMVVKQIRRNAASKTWPVVQAEVTQKEVHTHRNAKGYLTHTPQVTCKYSLQGTEYSQMIEMIGPWSRSSAQKALDEIGATMEVRYNPENPKESSHEYDQVKFMDYLMIVVAVVLGTLLIILQLAK